MKTCAIINGATKLLLSLSFNGIFMCFESQRAQILSIIYNHLRSIKITLYFMPFFPFRIHKKHFKTNRIHWTC
jgi:hypothetical protein